jgi:hypothetical protein
MDAAGYFNDLKIVPFISVGPFKLNSNINNYSSYEFTFYKCKEDDIVGWDTYDLNDAISIYTEQDIIVNISCHATCSLHGITVVGGHYSNFLQVFNPSDITHDNIYMASDDDNQDVYDIDDFGLQLWCKNDLIVTVICSLE